MGRSIGEEVFSLEGILPFGTDVLDSLRKKVERNGEQGGKMLTYELPAGETHTSSCRLVHID
jgi:hypothetical protein